VLQECHETSSAPISLASTVLINTHHNITWHNKVYKRGAKEKAKTKQKQPQRAGFSLI
jgi:hypothetical protein